MSGEGLPLFINCICQIRKYLRLQGLSEEEVGDIKIPWKIMRIVVPMVDWSKNLFIIYIYITFSRGYFKAHYGTWLNLYTFFFTQTNSFFSHLTFWCLYQKKWLYTKLYLSIYLKNVTHMWEEFYRNYIVLCRITIYFCIRINLVGEVKQNYTNTF